MCMGRTMEEIYGSRLELVWALSTELAMRFCMKEKPWRV